MNIFDFYDIYDYAEEAISSLFALGGVYIFFSVFIPLASYVFNCYMIMLTGRKAGYFEDWQAFVPFVKEYYEVRMIDDAWWKMFYFGVYRLVCIVLCVIFGVLIHYSIGIILALAYFGSGAYFVTVYFIKRYKGFGFHPLLAISRYLIWFYPVRHVIDCIIAISGRIVYNPMGSASVQTYTSPVYAGADNYASTDSVSTQKAIATGLSGMYKGADFDMGGGREIVFGRDASCCNVVFDQFNAKISRKHCGILFNSASNSYLVTDYSKNGVFYADGRQIPANVPTSVPKGTTVYLGSKDNMFILS